MLTELSQNSFTARLPEDISTVARNIDVDRIEYVELAPQPEASWFYVGLTDRTILCLTASDVLKARAWVSQINSALRAQRIESHEESVKETNVSKPFPSYEEHVPVSPKSEFNETAPHREVSLGSKGAGHVTVFNHSSKRSDDGVRDRTKSIANAHKVNLRTERARIYERLTAMPDNIFEKESETQSNITRASEKLYIQAPKRTPQPAGNINPMPLGSRYSSRFISSLRYTHPPTFRSGMHYTSNTSLTPVSLDGMSSSSWARPVGPSNATVQQLSEIHPPSEDTLLRREIKPIQTLTAPWEHDVDRSLTLEHAFETLSRGRFFIKYSFRTLAQSYRYIYVNADRKCICLLSSRYLRERGRGGYKGEIPLTQVTHAIALSNTTLCSHVKSSGRNAKLHCCFVLMGKRNALILEADESIPVSSWVGMWNTYLSQSIAHR